MGEKLNSGDMFPEMTLNLLSGGSLELAGKSDANYRVVLFYRAHW